MPTLPSSEAAPEPHRSRDIAESFGTDAERYDRARPRYPEALIRRVAATAPGPDLLDVGCGTGIAARQFQTAGCTVLGVEPDPRMAALARELGTETEVATFEDWEPGERRFDVVAAATAWHWVDLAAGAAKAARVLRPGGLLVPFWNVAETPPDLAEAVAVAAERVMPDSPFDFRAMLGRSMIDGYRTFLTRAADAIRAADGAFDEPEQWRYDWEFTYTRDAWLDVLPTQGAFTRLDPDQLAEILDAVGAAIDARGGTVTMPYATLALVTCSR
ncbi:class I SAM-dependent methyltransferase [Streptomyces sp. CdTB01]|uniref:class I SAM-dependent methyltransferase n=1 Tax=Streptomyces sp. CdTB01 TaxID=1725411 RepID=UPI00073A5B76|nr:class I SAM-dependent methyltransferase [Streptomyces sp. CdTB01]ALV34311.1 methyltransferase type 11 [Streptomyces sp. CdTB01]